MVKKNTNRFLWRPARVKNEIVIMIYWLTKILWKFILTLFHISFLEIDFYGGNLLSPQNSGNTVHYVMKVHTHMNQHKNPSKISYENLLISAVCWWRHLECWCHYLLLKITRWSSTISFYLHERFSVYLPCISVSNSRSSSKNLWYFLEF